MKRIKNLLRRFLPAAVQHTPLMDLNPEEVVVLDAKHIAEMREQDCDAACCHGCLRELHEGMLAAFVRVAADGTSGRATVCAPCFTAYQANDAKVVQVVQKELLKRVAADKRITADERTSHRGCIVVETSKP